MFQRRHYEAIAQIFRASISADDTIEMRIMRDRLVDDISDMFKANNPNFNAAWFIAACETEKE